MPLTATIQKKKNPSAPSCASGLSAGLNRCSNGCSISTKPLRSALRTAPIISSSVSSASGCSCLGRTNPYPQDQSSHREQGESGDHRSEQQAVVDAVAPRAGIVGGADESDTIDNSAEGELRGRAIDHVLHRFYEHRKRKILAIDMAVDLAIAIYDRGLGGLIEAVGNGAVAEAKILQQGFHGRC